MAVDRMIKVDEKEVHFAASARTPRVYRTVFGRDLFKDMQELEKSIRKSDKTDEDLSIESLETFENIAYVMALQGSFLDKAKDFPKTPDEWLDQFEILDIYQILPELMSLWGVNIETKSEPKKK